MIHLHPPRSTVRPRPLTLLFGLSLLLAACTPPPAPDVDLQGTGVAALGGVVVQGQGQPALAGSQVRLYLAGDHSHTVGRTQTDQDGRFGFQAIPAGRYDLAFSESRSAASDLLGAAAQTGPVPVYPVIQAPLRDPGGPTTVPSLLVSRPESGLSVLPGTPLSVSDHLDLEAKTAPGSLHQRPLRAFQVTLLQPDDAGAGGWSALQPVGGTVVPSPTTDPADSGPLRLSVGSVSGAALVQVAATDFNNNRVAQLFPATVTGTPGGPVSPPQDLRATAYTWNGPVQDPGLQPQALASAPPALVRQLQVGVSWSQPDSSGVRGFELWRTSAATGPWSRVALASLENCVSGLCRVTDSSASLSTGQDYFYRVTAVGRNRANSAVGNRPDTHTLGVFQPRLGTPAAGDAGVALLPVYSVVSPLAASGASGANLAFTVADDLLGTDVPWTVSVQLRQVYGQSGQPAGVPDHQVLLFRGGHTDPVYNDLTPASTVPGVGYDPATETLTLTHNFDGSGRPLQPARRVRWTLGRANAFRYQDPTRPPGALNPVVAVSVYSDPTGSGSQDCPAAPLLPGGPCLDSTQTAEFTTGAGP